MKHRRIAGMYVVIVIVALSGVLVTAALAWQQHRRMVAQATAPGIRTVSDTTISDSRLGSIYEWRDFRTLIGDAYAAKLDQLAKRGFSKLFVSVDGLPNDTALQPEYLQALASYADFCRQHGFTVAALAGEPDWFEQDKRPRALAMVTMVQDYNRSHADAPITELQFDVESYNSPAYAQDRQAVLNGFLQTVAATMKQSNAGSRLSVGFTVPFWFDEPNENVAAVDFNGKTQFPTQHVFDLAQTYHGFVVVMAYRNQLQGSDGILAHLATERTYAKQRPHAGLYVAQEVTDVQPAKVTYFSQSPAAFFRNSNTLNQAMNHTTYRGVVVNDLPGLSGLLR